MKLTIDVAMDYALAQGDPALVMILAAPIPGQGVLESRLEAGAATLRPLDRDGAPGQRIWIAPPDDRLTLRYHARVEVTRPDTPLGGLSASPWHSLPDDVLGYLRPSRLCPSDQFAAFARREFGHLDGGAKIAAMADWVAGWLSYVPGSSGVTTTAMDSFVSRQGVCRDYAHLMCSLARAAHIPARYTTGYGPDVNPPDFHALAEVWLGGAWHLVDPTRMSTPASLAVIGWGRDAGDATFMETEGWASLIQQRVGVTRD